MQIQIAKNDKCLEFIRSFFSIIHFWPVCLYWISVGTHEYVLMSHEYCSRYRPVFSNPPDPGLYLDLSEIGYLAAIVLSAFLFFFFRKKHRILFFYGLHFLIMVSFSPVFKEHLGSIAYAQCEKYGEREMIKKKLLHMKGGDLI